MRKIIEQIASTITESLGIKDLQIAHLLISPPDPSMGDIGMPCFELARRLGKSPHQIAADLVPIASALPFVRSADQTGPYLNLRLDSKQILADVLDRIAQSGVGLSTPPPGAGKTIVIDFSSPNIAKHLAIHHIRSTMIGTSLLRIFKVLGYRTVGINFLGDWGTSFGRLIAACRKWGVAPETTEDPVGTLNDLYVRYAVESACDPSLEEEARRCFRELEEGHDEARRMWSLFRDLSLKAFQKVYDLLGVTVDEMSGESQYEDRLEEAIQRIRERGLVTESRGALIVDLSELGLSPCLLRKSDGATLYHTRDIAAAMDRWERHHFDRCLYIVDAGQALHFQQLFGVLRKAGFEWADRLEHVSFGIVKFQHKRARSREGNIILLKDVLQEATDRVKAIIEEKNPDFEGRDTVARQVGIGAVVFNDLRRRRERDVEFDWDRILSFQGESGPYVQNAHVRVASILRKAGGTIDLSADLAPLGDPEGTLGIALSRFEDAVEQAGRLAEPSMISDYVIELAGLFHTYYHEHQVLGGPPDLTAARLRVVDAVKKTLAESLRLLGIEAPERM